MKEYYCWKCKKIMPFLDEHEWSRIYPLLPSAAEEIKDYRAKHNCDLSTARISCTPEASILFEKISGVPGVHFDIIYHHRLKDWGKECSSCGYLFRTPRAKHCANCGAKSATNI